MSNPLTTVEEFISKAVHHTRLAVQEAEARVAALGKAEQAKIAAEVRTSINVVLAAVKADTPEIEAAVKKGVQDALAAAEAVLKSRGL